MCGQAVCGRGRGRGRASNSKCVESVESVGVEHLREQSVDGRVAQQLEEEEVLEALETDRSDGRQAEKQLRESRGFERSRAAAVLLEGRVGAFSAVLDCTPSCLHSRTLPTQALHLCTPHHTHILYNYLCILTIHHSRINQGV